jgi:hypothetical protein
MVSTPCIAPCLQAEQQRQHLAVVQQQGARQREQLAARCEAIEMAGSALVRCLERLADAQGRLAGEDGAGLWRAMHSKLVARQNRLVGAAAGSGVVMGAGCPARVQHVPVLALCVASAL